MHQKGFAVTRSVVFAGLIAFLIVNNAFSAPYAGHTTELEQPDGTTVEVRLYGDEYFCTAESLDGYTLVRDPAGWIVYADVNSDASEFIPLKVKYDHRKATDPNNPAFTSLLKKGPQGKGLQKGLRLKDKVVAAQRQNSLMRQKEEALASPDIDIASLPAELTGNEIAPAPISGSVVGLTLLVEFQDVRGTIPVSEIDRYCNEIGYSGNGNNGSIRDYFYSVSNGAMDYTNIVTDYILLDYNKSYYDVCGGWGKTGELIDHALAKLCAFGFDFSSLTLRSGRVMAFNILYAGTPSCGWSEGLWPHASSRYVTVCGKSFGNYQMTNIGSSLRMRTFCHENGHMVCQYPDLYDYTDSSNGVGNFCLMAYGGSDTNPVPPCGYLRGTTGWETFTSINPDAPGSVRYHAANTNASFKYTNPSDSREYFLIESRQKTGRNASLPGGGLYVWHIRENGSNTNPTNHPTHPYRKSFKVALEQADGEFHLERRSGYGASNDLFYGGYKSYFTGSSSPDAVWWDTNDSGLKISNISAIGPTMSFVVGKEPKFIAHWRLDETEGTTASDSSASAHNGSLQNGLSFASNSWGGIYGRCLNFDGVDDYIELPDMPVCFTNGITISLWAYPTAVKTRARFIELGNGSASSNIIFGRYESTNDLLVQVYNGATAGAQVRAANAIELDKWQLFTVTISDSGDVKIYKNGVLANSGITNAPINRNYRYSNFIGKSNWSADAYYKGALDDINLFDRVLTESEVGALYMLEGQQPYNGQPAAIPGTIQAEHFDFGFEGIGYHDTTGGNAGGKLRPTEDVDIISTTDTDGGYAVADIADGEWLRYTVNSAGGPTDLHVRLSSIQQGQINVLFNSELVGVVDVPNTGSFSNWQTITVNDITLPPGLNSTLELQMVNGGFQLQWFIFKNRQPYLGEPFAIPGQIGFIDYDIGGQYVSYYDATAGNGYNKYRTDDVDIMTDTGGGYCVYIAANEWLEYTCNIQPGFYTVTVYSAGTTAVNNFTMSVNGAMAASFNMPAAGGWYNWQQTSVSNLYLSGGDGQILRFTSPSAATLKRVEFIRNYCLADINHDTIVNLEDLKIMAAQWLTAPGTPSADIAEPIDNIVNENDLMQIIENWLLVY